MKTYRIVSHMAEGSKVWEPCKLSGVEAPQLEIGLENGGPKVTLQVNVGGYRIVMDDKETRRFVEFVGKFMENQDSSVDIEQSDGVEVILK